MRGFGWSYPPGVTGNEPAISGIYRCVNCNAVLPEEADCPDCVEGKMHDVQDGEPIVEECGRCRGTGEIEVGDTCPGGCPERDWDAERDRQEGF